MTIIQQSHSVQPSLVIFLASSQSKRPERTFEKENLFIQFRGFSSTLFSNLMYCLPTLSQLNYSPWVEKMYEYLHIQYMENLESSCAVRSVAQSVISLHQQLCKE